MLKGLKGEPCSWGIGGLVSDTLLESPEDGGRPGSACGGRAERWRIAGAGAESGACRQRCVEAA